MMLLLLIASYIVLYLFFRDAYPPRPSRQNLIIASGILVILNLLDAHLTLTGINRFGLSYEGNDFIRPLLASTTGLYLAFTLKITFVGLFLLCNVITRAIAPLLALSGILLIVNILHLVY